MMSEWISVEDRLPPIDSDIIAYTKSQGVSQGFYTRWSEGYKTPAVLIDGHCRQFTHWMPLPEPPESAT